jgi:undecaprenyl-diphosphatase
MASHVLATSVVGPPSQPDRPASGRTSDRSGGGDARRAALRSMGVRDVPEFRGEDAPGRRCAAALALSWIVLVVVAVVVGRLLGATTELDTSVSEWFVERRTGGLDVVTRLFSLAGDTYTVIAISSAVVVVGIVRHHREGLIVLVTGMLGEVTIFLTITAIVARPRPEVPRLDGAPPTSSFPSGHTFAAIVLWGALGVVATRSRWQPWLRSLFLAMMVLMPLAIGVSRLYRGMHHLTDVTTSLVLGTVWLLIVVTILPPQARRGRRVPQPAA